MTSPTSARLLPSRRPQARAFTLAELLVVIGILVALAAILTPMVMNAYQKSADTRAQADLQAIGMALEAYKTDHGDYPRLTVAQGNNGAALLLHALLAPGAAAFDGNEGPGFRLRADRGRVYGPYLQSEQFELQLVAPVGIIDRRAGRHDDPTLQRLILYYPGLPKQPDIKSPGGYVAASTAALYNHLENADTPSTALFLPLADMQRVMGDANANGQIDPGETPAHTGPFVLWAPGADGLYGIGDDGRTDDITNFTISPDFSRR